MKKFISVFLAFLMIITMVPTTVFSAELFNSPISENTNCTNLKGFVTDYEPNTILDSVGYELKDSFNISFTSFSDSLKQRIGTYSACYADINNDNQDELIAAYINKNDYNYDSYVLELICFYTGADNYIYFSKLDTQRGLANSDSSQSCDVYIENGYIYIENSFASGIEGSGSSWRDFKAIYNFEDNNWNYLEDYYHGVSYGTAIFIDNINNISLNTYFDISDYEQIEAHLEQKQNKLKNTYKLTASDDTKIFDSGFLLRSNDFSWKVEGIVDENYIFNRNKYIADIWLNNHDKFDSTIENNYINSLLSVNGHFSADIAANLNNDKAFQNSVAAWKALEVIFSPAEGTAELAYLDKNEIYQALVFDLIKQCLTNEEYSEVISSEYTEISDNLVGTFGTGCSILQELNVSDFEKFQKLALSNDIEMDQKYFKILYDNFKSSEKVFLNLDNFSSIAKGIIQGVSTITDFINKISMYYIAMDLSLSQSTVLYEMATHTTESSLKDALNTIADIAKSDDFSAGLLDAINEAGAEMTIYLTSAVTDELMKFIPIYGTLKLVYEVSSTAVNLLLNTNGIIDSYYLISCTSELCNASKMSIAALAESYEYTPTESNARAYIESVKMYIKLIGIDLESGCNFIKAASEEGLYNLSKKVDKKILSFFGFSTENTYDEVCKSKDSIMQSVGQMYDWIETSWILSEDYLKSDYPQIYPIYAQEEILKDTYTPVITNARINKDGKTEVEFGYINWVDGIKISEKIENSMSYYSTTAGYTNLTCYNDELKNVYPKKYTAYSYFNSEEDKVYSNPSDEYSVSSPLLTPTVTIPTFREVMATNYGKFNNGITIAISDPTNAYYDNIKYHIFRKSDNSEFEEIAVIDRNNLFNGKTTLYSDPTVLQGNCYSYRVQSEIVFNNGVCIASEVSNSITFGESLFDNRLRNIEITDLRTSNNSLTTFSLLSYRENKSVSNDEGIKIMWATSENATGYEIYRKPAFGQIYKKIATVSDCIYIDTDVVAGSSYDYIVIEYSGSDDNKIYADCSDVGSIDYKSIEITEIDSEVYVGERIQLNALTCPSNESVQWLSDNESIAIINSDGLLTAKSAGTVNITAILDNGLAAKIKITVTEKENDSLGDVNGDGKITAADARLALRISAQIEIPTETQLVAADLTGDGKVTAADARKILRISAGLETI